MYAYVSQILAPTLFCILLPSVLSLPYSIYGIKSYRRSGMPNNQMPLYQSAPQYNEQPYVSSARYPTHHQPYEADGNYFLGDGINRHIPQYQSYGMPTYLGDYKPTPYYYAHGPSYNYFDDRIEATNPLDDLHEEMLQEDERERQSTLPIGQEQYFENNGQPKSLTNNYLNDLIIYNNKLNAERERDVELANEYEEDEPYYSDVPNQSYEFYDQQPPQPSKLRQLPIDKQDYYSHASNNDRDEFFGFGEEPTHNNQNINKVKDDKNVRELKSLSKNNGMHDADDEVDDDESDDYYSNQYREKTNKNGNYRNNNAAYNSFDSGDDYDDDTWINWDRKRSFSQKHIDKDNINEMKPLKALEYQLTMALKSKEAESASITTTAIPPTPSVDNVLGLLKLKTGKHHEGQKEVVLSRPAAPIRHTFSDPVLQALSHSRTQAKEVSLNATICFFI